MWCCGTLYNELLFKEALKEGWVHIHTGDENPLVNKNFRKFSLVGGAEHPIEALMRKMFG